MEQIDENSTALPKPIALTPEEVQQIAAGTAAVLPVELSAGAIAGRRGKHCPSLGAEE